MFKKSSNQLVHLVATIGAPVALLLTVIALNLEFSSWYILIGAMALSIIPFSAMSEGMSRAVLADQQAKVVAQANQDTRIK